MNHKEKNEVIKRYSDRLEEYGTHPKTLGWDKERHFLRYQILLSEWNLKGASLLDVGCGFGDMYAFTVENNLQVAYTGVDINQDLIDAGKEKYPEAHLKAKDVINATTENEYDFVVSSGVHNLKLEDNWSFIKQTFDRFNALANKGFALNFISDKVDKEFKKDHIYYTSPEDILRLAYRYSNRVVLRNDYMPFEFTIFVDLRTEFDKEKTVYPDYLQYFTK